jgi:acyl-CoA oxidase
MFFLFSGIEIGEIGTKIGMHTVNNGFLRFDKVRIPREHMLMKHSKVLEVRNTELAAFSE